MNSARIQTAHLLGVVVLLVVELCGMRSCPAAAATEDAAAPAGFDQPRQVPHGKVTPVAYESKALGFKRRMMVYTPPGYSTDHHYPVLYLLHGAGDDETGWVQKGSADVILDNLYADQKAEPMIVVMPYGFTNRPGEPVRDPNATPESRRKSAALFERDLLEDIIPYVEAHYPAMADADHRALAGLSMGGGQTLRIGPTHSDTFAYLGVFSAGIGGRRPEGRPDVTATYPDPKTLNDRLKLFWISCGDHDPGIEGARKLDQVLQEKKIHHVWHLDSGAHEWPVWKNDLYLVAPRLFKGHKAEARVGALGVFEADADVGTVTPPGAATFDAAGNAYRIRSAGENVWNAHDDFHYVYRRSTGDLTIGFDAMRFDATTGNAHRKAGAMVRQSLDPDAPYVDVMIHGDGLIAIQYRAEAGGITRDIKAPDKAPAVVRLERRGDKFTLLVGSSDGSTHPAGSVKLALHDPVLVGLAACSHDPAVTVAATFTGVTLHP